MTPQDLSYLHRLFERGLLRGPVLEVGGRSWQEEGNAAKACADAGLDWEATDIKAGPGVSYELDILSQDSVASIDRQWPTVLVLNLLEHVYDPVLALTHAVQLVEPGGSCVALSPAVWELHDYPADYWRPMPDFYLEFGRRNNLLMIQGTFEWLVGDQHFPVASPKSSQQKLMPGKASPPFKSRYSDAIHKLARTVGRSTFFPYSSLACVYRIPERP